MAKHIAASKKILVIDDDSSSCSLIEDVLARQGFEVVSSHDARAGLDAARAIKPDLMFINLLLPDTNGLKVSKAIHAIKDLEKVPVIMLISHQGELDPKYTMTIGILDTLVKPLKESEVIAKTGAILGVTEGSELQIETLREAFLEEETEPMIVDEAVETAEEAELAPAMKTLGQPGRKGDSGQDDARTMSELTKEGEFEMPEKENPFDRKGDDDRDLFTDESDMFSDELRKSRTDAEQGFKHEEDDHIPEDDDYLTYEQEKPANPVRRILLIAVSIVAGIGLGVAGYFYFTAGSKVPVEKQIVKALPEPAPQPAPTPAAIPSEKPNVIPELPIKAEPQKPETALTKETKTQETLPKAEAKKEPEQKTEAGKPVKEKAPVVAQAGEKKPATVKKPSRQDKQTAVKGKLAYYVQTGVFENEANAKAMAEKLKGNGYAPSVKKIEGKDNKVMFRVAAGTYASFKKAVEVSEVLNKQGVRAIVHKQ